MKILVYGSREFGLVVKALVIDCGHQFAGFIDDWHVGPDVLGRAEDIRHVYAPCHYGIALAIGYRHLEARWEIYESMKKAGYEIPVLIHPNAYVRDRERVGQGSFIMAGAIVDVNVTIGALSVVWPGVAVSHDCVIGENAFLSPNATICGCVAVGNASFIGAGAVVVDHVIVPPKSFVKAGSVHTGTSNSVV